MTGLLLQYNKVHNDALTNLCTKISKISDVVWGNLSSFGTRMDLLSFSAVSDYLSSLDHFDYVVIGDVFWPTGQNICRFCRLHKKHSVFLQHGQWIYVDNKKKLPYYPDCTLLFGDDVAEMCGKWEYAENSKIFVTGTPRYDHCGQTLDQNYVYFSPPVIEEVVHGKPCGKVRIPFLKTLEKLSGIDKQIPLMIQPHYREGRVEILRSLFPLAQFADPKLNALDLVRKASHVLTSRNSTMVLDAIACFKPVVLVDLLAYDCCFFKRGHFGEFARESNSTGDVVRNFEPRTDFDAETYHIRARKHIRLGDASERICNIIKYEIF